MGESLLLKAFEGTNECVPVWFMRQAGRFLPEYRKIKEKYTLEEMFRNPEIAAKITCLPVDILNVDAAILFADILTLPSAMGIKLEFNKENGPQIKNPIANAGDVKRLHDFEDLLHVAETIQLTNTLLPDRIPLIGFAGSPFTVACYLIEGGGTVNFTKLFHFMAQEVDAFGALMKILTKNTIDYLNLQKKAGVQVFQLFDTWGGILRAADYAHFDLPNVEEIFQKVDLPSIYYLKNCNHLLALMEHSQANFLSVCHTVVLGHNPVLEKTKKGVQGNLFNGLLYADYKTLEREITDVLLGAKHYKKYIFNLSHGIFPDVDVNKVKFVIDQVHQFNWRS